MMAKTDRASVSPVVRRWAVKFLAPFSFFPKGF